jgi:formylglycine-generating enzyme required for sulfatase activity
MPDEVGHHPASRSIFGVDDMIGNALEWTLGDGGTTVRRGGGWGSAYQELQLDHRERRRQQVRDWSTGFRICLSITIPN